MKKGMRRWIALLLAAAMLFACTVTALAANGFTAATVTLRIEYAEQSETVPVELTVTHRDFSEYGLTDLTDPGYVTPIHVLAEYFVQERQVAVAEVKNYIGISGTYLSTIDGSSGSKQGQGGNLLDVCRERFDAGEAGKPQRGIHDGGLSGGGK